MSKGITYIAVDPGMAEDPRILEVATAFALDPYALAGRCARFFGRVAEHRPDGDLSGLPSATLDAWTGGGVAGLGVALISALADDTGKLRAWDRYNGSALRAREAARERAAARRQAASGKPDANSSGIVREQFANGAGLVRDNHTVPEIHNSSNYNAREVAAGFFAKEADPVPELYVGALEGALRASGNPDRLLQELGALVSGLHGPGGRPVPVLVIGRAIHEMNLAGSKMTPIALRRFCVELMRPENPSDGEARRGRSGKPSPAPVSTEAAKLPSLA